MRKSCCIGEGGICARSSNSMILRSACSHSHSPISKTVTETKIRQSTPKPRKENNESNQAITKSEFHNNLQFGSILESSLKGLVIKSAEESYSLSKEFCSTIEFSGSNSFATYEASLLNSTCEKEQNHDSISSNSYLNDSLLRKEKCSDYSSGVESDLNKSDTFSKMSGTQRMTRSSISRRAISESESEEESLLERKLIGRKGTPDLNSNTNLLVSGNHGLLDRGMLSHLSSNSQVVYRSNLALTNNNVHRNSGGTPENKRLYFSESPQLNVSDVQYSYFDRVRWFIWKCIYLKIIKNINFDVWCLSRLNHYGKFKAISMLLLLFCLVVVWGSAHEEWQTCFTLHTGDISSIFHSISTYLSSYVSSLQSYLSHQEEITSSTSDSQTVAVSRASYLYSLCSMLSGLFYKSADNPTSNREESEFVSIHEENKDKMRLLAVEIFKEEAQNLLKTFENSFSHLTLKVEEKKNELNFKSEIDDLRQEVQAFKESIIKFQEDIRLNMPRNEKLENSNKFASDFQGNLESVNTKIKIIEQKIEALGDVKKCCDQKWNSDQFLASIETSLIAALKKVIKAESEDNSAYQFFYDWLNSKFINRETMFKEIKLAIQQSEAEHKLSRLNLEKMIETLILRHVDAMKANLTLTDVRTHFSSTSSTDVFSGDTVRKIVKEALVIYDADKTGKADYALESAGGSVIGTRCSEAYVEKSGRFSILGLPLWSYSNSPRTVIQPGMQPGQCWAFKGSQGFLVLELSSMIYPSGFTLEHIPVSLSPTESIDSAPKEFSVWGLISEEDNTGKMLAKCSYDNKGDSLQYFPIQNFIGEPFQYLELKIHSNHGNMDYTCLYRFRVHGKRVR